FLPFIVDMPRLFESFFSAWMKLQLPREFRVRAQYAAKLDAGGNLQFRIDNVLSDRRTNRVLAVLDTKYKGSHEPDEADIQQIVAYAVRMGVTEGVLVYPSTATVERALQVGPVWVRTKCFDLSSDLNT